MVAALVTAVFVPLKKAAVFLIPFTAVFTYWAVYAFILSSANDFILAQKIAELLMLDGNPFLLIMVTGVIGGVAAGFSGILGRQLVAIINSK